MKRLRRIVKWTIVGLCGLVVLAGIGAVLALRAFVLPDSDQFGQVKDEAMKENLDRTYFKAAADPYFVDMDKQILKAGTPYSPQIESLAKLTGLTPEKVREHAIKGQNAWIVWTGGNDLFWDDLARQTAGNFDLLKLISSHPSQGYGRYNRWHYLGLVNEPCFKQASAESAKKERFGLWIDERDPSCPKDPFADETKYPGVKTGARGTTLVYEKKSSGDAPAQEVSEAFPVGSAYGEATGIIGLRLFPNPKFDAEAAERWDPVAYYENPDYYLDADLVKPYRVGMSCAFCHVGPSPVDSPPSPEAPEFKHLNSNPGAQYFWVDRIFVWDTRARTSPDKPAPNEHNFVFQLFHTNPPGALDTSLVSTDYINNPRTMNAVYDVGARLVPSQKWGSEVLTGGERDNKQFDAYEQTKALGGFWDSRTSTVAAARVLKDGSDSVGVLGALNRVYLNIGLFSEEWTLHFRPVIGGRKISPIRIADAQKNSAYWGATEDMTADMALFFLATATPDRLKDVAGAARHLPKDEAQVRKGKVVFARNCAACHSSKIPLPPEGSGVDEGSCARGGNGPQYRECWDRYWSWANSEPFKRAMTEIVLDERFLENNFLSTERRVPVDLLKTNACSALATNALAGDIWDNFSSTSYKQLPPVKELTVHHPVSGGERSLQPLGNGRGYSRPASLVSLWSTAPYLQNNSVGHDPSYYPVAQDYGYGAGNTGGTPAYSRAAYGEDAPPVGTGYAGEKTEQPPAPTQGTAPYNTGSAGSGVSCPAKDGSDPYLPCVDNRMQVFDQSIRELLDPGKRRLDPVLPEETRAKVGGYLYRTTANSCLVVPKGYLPLGLGNVPWLTNALADWAFAENGDLTLGPLPKDFPVNALVNTKLLPDNDEPAGMSHYWRLGKASFTLLSTFKQLGGTCSSEELDDPKTQLRAEKVLRETGFIDTLVGLSKCPDYVVNRGHEFGKDLTPEEREDLIAFLKLL